MVFDGIDLVKSTRRDLRDIRPHLQMIFQDPYKSVDPKWRVADIPSKRLPPYRP